MKKKLSLMLCLCFMVLAMTACGTDPKSVDYFGMSYSDIQDNMEQTVSALVSFSDEDIQSGAEYYDSNGMDAFAHLLTSWGETVSDSGFLSGTWRSYCDKSTEDCDCRPGFTFLRQRCSCFLCI